MKKQNPILFLLFLAFLACACGDDEVVKAGKDEVRAAFQTANSQIENDLGQLNLTSGFVAMNQLSVLTSQSDPFGKKSSKNREQVIDHLKSGVYAIRGILTRSTANGRLQGNEPFDYNAHKGVYAWNAEQQKFLPAGESQIVEIRFPSEGADSPNNDAVFRLTAYSEKATPNGDQPYSPTLIKASIFVDNTKELELDAEVEYNNADEPVKADVYYFVNPFALEISFNDKKDRSTSASETLSKSGKVLIGFGATINYNSAGKNEEDINAFSGYVQLVDIKFTIRAKASDISGENPYDAVKISIMVRNKTGGKIVLEPGESGEPVPFVKYTDGSMEPLSDLLDFTWDVEAMLK